MNLLIRIFLTIFALVFFPVFLLIALILYFELKENPIFIQERALNLKQKPFRMFKFRTLRSGTFKENSSVFVKDRSDYKISRFCSLLRRTGIDELPQILNIIFGSMNLIGPRPFTISDLKILKEFNRELYYKREELKSKPGITGYWQVYGNREQGLKNVIAMDEYYEKNRSLSLDFKIILKSLKILFFASHSDSLICFTESPHMKNAEGMISNSGDSMVLRQDKQD